MTPGRNDPCHCGSGQKYKKCHQAADEAAARTQSLAAQAAAAADRAAEEAAEKAEEEKSGKPRTPDTHTNQPRGKGLPAAPGRGGPAGRAASAPPIRKRSV